MQFDRKETTKNMTKGNREKGTRDPEKKLRKEWDQVRKQSLPKRRAEARR